MKKNTKRKFRQLPLVLKTMKVYVIFLIIGIGTASAGQLYSQSTLLSLNMENVSVEQVISEIEKCSEYIFLYKKNLPLSSSVSIKVKKETLPRILDKILAGKNYTYTINGRQVVISQKKEEGAEKDEKTVKVTGVISDINGDPLSGAVVQVEGTTRGVTADLDGSYTIEVKATDKLIVSFLGYETKNVPVNNRTSILIQLEEKGNLLDEVTVVAFGKQKKESVIGSITTISPKELKVPSSNLTTSLAGRVAGMISYQRSGEPGADNATFFIRGVTTFGYKVDPLILIDNVEVTTTDLARLQPDDIESFSIMKDATATALYGARGANGVILVTTKTGKEGKAQVRLRFENSFSGATKNIDFVDPVSYMRLHNEAVLTRNPLSPLPYSQSKIENTEAGMNPYVYPATDWKEMLMNDYATNQRLNVNVSGGGTVARYYVAAGYTKDNGILKTVGSNNFNNNIDLQTFSLRSNINISLTKSTELVVRLNGTFDDYTGPLQGGKAVYNMAVRTNPVLFPPYFPSSAKPEIQHIMYGNAQSESEGLYLNPYAELTRGYKDYSRSKMLAQMELSQGLDFFTKGLSYRVMANTSRSSYFDVRRYYKPYFYAVSAYDKATDVYDLTVLNEKDGSPSLGYSEGGKTISSVFYMEHSLNYNRTFRKKHDIGALLVFNMREELNANAGELQLSLPSRNMGLAGRTSYAYDRRYFAELNFGYNGSERFSKDNRFGFFPSFGLGWSVSNEQFWKPLKNTLSKLRIRSTYGLVGNDAIGSANDRFYYLSNIANVSNIAQFGTNNGYKNDGVKITRYSNPDITWEVSTKKNIALEIGLFNKINIEAEYFDEYRKNILMQRANIPVSMGLAASIKANVGEASSRGTDISIDYSQFFNKDFWVQARGNFTYATSQYEVYEETEYDEPWRSRIGHPIRQEWLYLAERLFVDEADVANSPTQFGEYMAGDIKYRDINGDGKITGADMVPAGYPTVPEISYGFGASIGYKNIDFSVFFQGVARESFRIGIADTAPFLDNYSYKFDGVSYQSNNQMMQAYADSHWSEDNRDIYALWPRLSTYSVENNIQRSTWFQRDGGFLRLKQLELGYTLSELFKANKHISFRLYANATNLFCWSKFKLWDPEMAADGLGYPVQRVFNVGISASF